MFSFKDGSHPWEHHSYSLYMQPNFYSSRINSAAAAENLWSSLTQVISEMGRKKTPHSLICPSLLSIAQNKAPVIWVWALIVQSKRWWSSDLCNSIQVFLDIKILYGHIIKERSYCLDRRAAWFQVANGVLMCPSESRPSFGQTGKWWLWYQWYEDWPWEIIKSYDKRWYAAVTESESVNIFMWGQARSVFLGHSESCSNVGTKCHRNHKFRWFIWSQPFGDTSGTSGDHQSPQRASSSHHECMYEISWVVGSYWIQSHLLTWSWGHQSHSASSFGDRQCKISCQSLQYLILLCNI